MQHQHDVFADFLAVMRPSPGLLQYLSAFHEPFSVVLVLSAGVHAPFCGRNHFPGGERCRDARPPTTSAGERHP